jgi:hypothetical protein
MSERVTDEMRALKHIAIGKAKNLVLGSRPVGVPTKPPRPSFRVMRLRRRWRRSRERCFRRSGAAAHHGPELSPPN